MKNKLFRCKNKLNDKYKKKNLNRKGVNSLYRYVIIYSVSTYYNSKQSDFFFVQMYFISIKNKLKVLSRGKILLLRLILVGILKINS